MNDELSNAQMNYLSMLLDSGCKFRHRTSFFGKPYVWMTDRFGQWFLERIPA